MPPVEYTPTPTPSPLFDIAMPATHDMLTNTAPSSAPTASRFSLTPTPAFQQLSLQHPAGSASGSLQSIEDPFVASAAGRYIAPAVPYATAGIAGPSSSNSNTHSHLANQPLAPFTPAAPLRPALPRSLSTTHQTPPFATAPTFTYEPRSASSSRPRVVPGQPRGFWVYQDQRVGIGVPVPLDPSRPHSAPHHTSSINTPFQQAAPATAVRPGLMSLATAAPVLPSRHYGMSYPTEHERVYASPATATQQYRPPSSHGGLPPPPPPPPQAVHPDPGTSPDRLHSSHGYHRGSTAATPQTPSYPHEIPPPGSSHGYPMTPMSGPAFAAHPSSSSYYGLTTTPSDPAGGIIPSPPPTSNGRPLSANFTPDGNPIVPVGISGGKMFQCRGYGDCDKVFTRSEHLARHVRKHTGERPFPCHCGKAFSRLDNLRQHAATVHADQAALNDQMLSHLAPVHANLSARANKDQRRRGEVVEVPKNAVERPRHTESFPRKESPPDPINAAAYPPYTDPPQHQHQPTQWDQHGRPRTSGEYPPGQGAYQPTLEHPTPISIDTSLSGPSRRTASEAYPPYYDPRPPTAPGTGSSGESINQVQYPYRPVSSSGRDLGVQHYAESEPPSSSHGHPPQSPMYPAQSVPGHGGLAEHGHGQPSWSSPPSHAGYPAQMDHHQHQSMYALRPDPYPYPGDHHSAPAAVQQPPHATHAHISHYGPPPPGSAGSAYGYAPHSAAASYYGPNQSFAGQGVHQQQQQPPQQQGYQSGQYPQPHESPFQYHAPPGTAGGEYTYPPAPPTAAPAGPAISAPPAPPAPPAATQTQSQGQKRRGEELSPSSRKNPRPSSAIAPPPPPPPPQSIRPLQEQVNNHGHEVDDGGELWFPPTTERRSSLAISALLGSPQLDHRPRPLVPVDNSAPSGNAAQGQGQGQGQEVKVEVGAGTGGDMEEKARALLGSSH